MTTHRVIQVTAEITSEDAGFFGGNREITTTLIDEHGTVGIGRAHTGAFDAGNEDGAKSLSAERAKADLKKNCDN